ncbi:virginiamycin B lyase family protein [Bradyrhizobium barranii]
MIAVLETPNARQPGAGRIGAGPPRLAKVGLSAALLGLLVGGALGASAQGLTHTVHMLDAAPFFSEPELAISVGDTVVWRNDGPEKKHIVADQQMNIFSGGIEPNGSWRYTFDYASEYQIICGQHYYMRSKVVVRNQDGTTERRFQHPYQAAFKEFVIPTREAVPRMIIRSKVDETIWFTIGGGGFYGFEEIAPQNKIAQIDETGQFVEYSTPTPDGDGSKVGVDSLVMAENGDIWFTERLTNRIGVLRGDGSINEHQIPTPGGYALGVDIDGKGNIWFAEREGNKIGFIAPGGEITEIEMPRPNSEPRTIQVDSRGLVWYTAREANEIGYYDPEKRAFGKYQIPTKLARPAGIAEGRDGAIYFVEMVGNKIGKIEHDKITEYALPTPFAAPFKIVADAEGILWFTEVYGNAIGRFDPSTGAITEYKIPTKDSRPGGIAIDGKGRVWFIEQKGNKVGYLDPKAIPQAPSGEPATTKSHAGVPAGKVTVGRVEPALPTGLTFSIPTPGAHPGGSLVEDRLGRLWFPLILANRVGVYDPRDGSYRDYEMPTEISMPVALDVDSAGDVWVAQFRGNRLGRLAMDTGRVTDFEIPVADALPSGVTVDERGSIWVSLLKQNRIVAFDRDTHSFREYQLPRPESMPLTVLADRRGSVWVTASNEENSYVARFDIEKRTFEEIELPVERAVPVGLLVDSNDLWVAFGGAASLARYDLKKRTWVRYQVPGSRSEPSRLAKDSLGRVWATDGGGLGSVGGNQLVMVDPLRGSVRTIPMGSSDAKPNAIVAASDGNIWFTQQGANRLSQIKITEDER